MNYKRAKDRNDFVTRVEHFYHTQGRHTLPWRVFSKSVSASVRAYRVLVSEVMLQQTQVERVIPYYTRFIKNYPNPQKLSEASLREVLVLWQGLGYNRRARMLHEASKEIVAMYKGVVPTTYEALRRLPGVGDYTASAVMAFAYDREAIVIETNIRTAISHHFFKGSTSIPDSDIRTVLTLIMPPHNVRGWYSALMDYGAHLKRAGVKINAKSAHYTKQKAFKGSVRELRGAMLKALLTTARTKKSLTMLFGKERERASEEALHALLREGLVVKKKNSYTLPD
jgi:A/G-specific adenine glycosylase